MITSHVFYIRVDSRLPSGAERSGRADGADRFTDHVIVERRAHLVAFVIHRTFGADAEAGGFLRRVDVRAEEQKLPAVFCLLPLDHPLHCLVAVAAAGVFIAVGGDDEQRLFRHILPPGVLVDIADMMDGFAYRVEQRCAPRAK